MSREPVSQWRRRAQPIVAHVLAETRGMPEREIKRALRAAYPFGPRSLHPYRVWRDEIARQRGRKPPLGTVVNQHIAAEAAQTENPNQGRLL